MALDAEHPALLRLGWDFTKAAFIEDCIARGDITPEQFNQALEIMRLLLAQIQAQKVDVFVHAVGLYVDGKDGFKSLMDFSICYPFYLEAQGSVGTQKQVAALQGTCEVVQLFANYMLVGLFAYDACEKDPKRTEAMLLDRIEALPAAS